MCSRSRRARGYVLTALSDANHLQARERSFPMSGVDSPTRRLLGCTEPAPLHHAAGFTIRCAAVNLFFVDDSGDPTVGVITALVFPWEVWPKVLKEWLGWRKWLWKQYQLPTDFEIHAQEFVSGHGTVPDYEDAEGVLRKPEISSKLGLRKEVYRRSLAQIERQSDVRIITIACEGLGVPGTYSRFVALIDEWLRGLGEWGIFIVDGKDDSAYRPAHRKLELRDRRIIEDPLMQSSRHSQLIQMADLVAHAAFQHVKRDEDKRFMWDWYPRQLAGSSFEDAGLPLLLP